MTDSANDAAAGLTDETRTEKAQRLQWLLQQMFREVLQENNRELCQNLRESVIKELDYQFRIQEEKEEERDRIREEREELHYQKLDELLRAKSGRMARRERLEKPRKSERSRKSENSQRVKALFFKKDKEVSVGQSVKKAGSGSVPPAER